jgi:DNA polymerase V
VRLWLIWVWYNAMMKVKIESIYKPDLSTSRKQPYFEAKVPAGFPSPAADYEENQLDLNKHLIKNPAATFFVRVSGDSMTGAGIHDGDLMIVDRSLNAKDKNVVIAVVNGELTVKRIRIRKKKVFLEAENVNYPTQEISNESDFQVWGVVTNVIHAV